MQFWSLSGAKEALGDVGRVDRLDTRTLEWGHTKTFACWLWVWDVAHIPTKRALLVLKWCTGRADEIISLAPFDRRIPPPSGVRCYDLLIHVDLLEDWTLSPRSSHSGQSGMPSSDEDDDRPLPRIEPGTWVASMEDDQGRARRGAPRIGAAGCVPLLGSGGRDQEDGGGSGGLGQSWRDRLLGRGCHAKGKDADVVKNAHRRRSRTSVTGGRGRSQAGKDVGALVLRATPPPLGLVPTPQVEEDPAQFFSFSGTGRALSPPPRTDCMQLEMENAMLEALDTPLDFEDGGRSPPRLDAGPCRAGKPGDASVPAALHKLPRSSHNKLSDGGSHSEGGHNSDWQ
ncbi:D-3-phosphoglycerate dehydrogenase, chloroplastic [Hordeum vulgare]|uniref:Predicted protein n=1 Tax=Hordeum vulgare subsp. vulgare TaxID=112509 RepID=F2D059_HORVV|nr:uncharacterized protein LOC123426947 [Hordeum vulgare subsp. vulgare]KAE8808856.1 D-3-phosphoglycerate dehydrogenase, chloroplastic [Hordeum vulgare]BAJ88480.1 predicted protein [Hordeum vulgare subsp. vulgare]